MRLMIIVSIALLVIPGLVSGSGTGKLDVKRGVMRDVGPPLMSSGADCVMGSYYMLDGCGFATVVEGIGENETFGVCFSMSEPDGFHEPCDTLACMRLDIVEIVLYDVLAPPADQSMNLKIYSVGPDGEPAGELLGNRDFEPAYVDTAVFTSVEIDFTNGGMEPGLDLSGCSGCFVALLTWKNSTGHPCLALDNISSCVDECGTSPECCEMGAAPYVYPRPRTHTYFYGSEGAWARQDSICDPQGCGAYGCLEAIWDCGFCTSGTATEATTWGGIKANYR